MNGNEPGKHDRVLAHLVFMLETAAMQQLGKLVDPSTGQARRDLEQARATIDVLEMLKHKCRTDTPEDLLRSLDSVVMNLQLNYLDEVKKARREEADAGAEDKAAPEADEAGGDANPGAETDAGRADA